MPAVRKLCSPRSAICILSHAIQFCSYSGAAYTCVAPLLSSVIANWSSSISALISNSMASVHDPLTCYSGQLIKADVYMRSQMILHCSLYSRLVENTDTFIFQNTDGAYYPKEHLHAISTCIIWTVINNTKTKQASKLVSTNLACIQRLMYKL